MAVGAFASFKLMTAFPELNVVFAVLGGGVMTALVGLAFGLPSLRIKGFYLAVATLAAQFFLVWLFNKVPWFMNYSATGQINAPVRSVLGWEVTGAAAAPAAKYLFCLVILFVLAWAARNLTRGRDRPLLDGDPRHGHRRRDHRRQPAARQALGLRDLVVLHRRRRARSTSRSISARSRSPTPSASASRSSCSS